MRKIAQIFVAFSEKLNFRNKPKKCYLRKTLALLCLPRGVKLMTTVDDLDERAQITSLIIQLDNCCQNRTQNSRFFSSTGYSFSESPYCSTLYQKKITYSISKQQCCRISIQITYVFEKIVNKKE